MSKQTQLDNMNVAVGRVWLHTWLNMGWGFLFIVLSRMLVEYGSIGIAYARMISYASRLIILLVILFCIRLFPVKRTES